MEQKTDKNTKIDNVKEFIREIEQREPLWKNHHKYYYNKAVVNKHWTDVGALFNLEVADAKQKWKNLRDTFRVEVKKVRNKSFVNEYDEYEEFKSTWSHYSDMSFLKEMLKTRASTSFSERSSAATRNDEASSECNSSGLKFEFVENDPFSPESLNEGSIVGSHTMDDNDDDNDEQPAEIIHITTTGRSAKRRKTEKSEEAEDSDDDDMLFFRSLLPFIKKMDLDKKLMFRTEVQKKLYETLFDK